MNELDSLFVAFASALAGRYSIDRELGRGGMGIVYLAREVHLDRLVAIKLLPPERAEDPTLRERFMREARLAAKLSHPNVIPIHAVEETGGFVFFVMAYVEGETLASRVRERGPLPSAEGTRVLREVAWALAYAHGQGLVHRDVKPDNILLEAGTGRVLVADFGIAAAAGETGGAPVSGTPEFMSPELVLGRNVDARSDLYALGATAFYAFSGRLPFEGASATEVLAKHVSEPAPPLASLGLTVPRKLAAIVDRCLAKEPDHRPASADALAEQLGVAIQQRRELPPALRGFVRRNGRMNSTGAMLAGVLTMVSASVVMGTKGGMAALLTFSIPLIVLPVITMVDAARGLLKFGFAHDDLGPSFASESEQAREERMIERTGPPTFVERWAPSFAQATGTAFVLSYAAMLALPTREYDLFAPRPGLIIATTVSLLLTIVAMSQQKDRDVDTDFWGRLWTGKFGKFAFAVARKLLGKRVRVSAMTHRATELSLSLAAEQLYESLPKADRALLSHLPAVIKRLQEDAQLLRKRHDEMQDAIASSDPASPHATEIRKLRDELHAKLGDAVGALETVRLGLLRLHAGTVTVDGLTTHLGIAAEVAAEVERLVAAHDSVDHALKFPRSIAPSPA